MWRSSITSVLGLKNSLNIGNKNLKFLNVFSALIKDKVFLFIASPVVFSLKYHLIDPIMYKL